MKRLYLLLFPILFLFSISLDSCSGAKSTDKKNEIVEIDPGFSNYISAFTGGLISNQSTIQIRLAAPYEGEINMDEPIPGDLFDFTPSVPGRAYWRNNTTIEFIPEEPLISNQLYKASFKLGKLMEVPAEFQVFEFNFKIKPQTFHVYVDGINTPSFDQPENQIIEGRLMSSDIIDTTSLKKIVHAFQEGSELPVKWDFTGGLVKKFIVKNVKRKTIESKVTLEWNGGGIDAELSGSKEIFIPALGDFKIVDISVVQAPEQHAVILFSDPLDDGQDLSGIVSLGENNISTIVDGHKLLVYPDKRITGDKDLSISGSIRNISGFKLNKPEKIELVFEDIKPEVELLGNGVIVPSTQGAQVPFKSVNLKAVDVYVAKIYEENIIQFLQVNDLEGQYQLKRVGKTVYKQKLSLEDKGLNLNSWNNFSIDLSSIIKVEPGAIYRVSITPRKNYSLYSCTTNASEQDDDDLINMAEDETEWSEKDWGSNYYYDYDDGYDYYYDYDYSDRDNPCKNYYYRDKTVSRNVLISDIGLIAKAGADRRIHVFVTDLNTTKPLVDAKVKFYDFQQQLLGSTSTDEKGMCDMFLKTKPFVVVAENGTQKAYLKLRDGESNSLSKFDVSGTQVEKGVKGFIYTERGVWRPGDSLYVTFILEDREDVIPDNHPVKFEMIDSRGVTVDRQVATANVNGFYDFRTATYESAPTGNYRAKVSIGNRSFSKTLKIETVKPNRLKIYLEFADKILKKKGGKKAELNVKWLHGAVAKNLKAKVDVTVSSSYTSFEGYKGFIFDDPIKRFSTDQQTIFNDRLDQYGVAQFDPKIYVTDAAPGMLKANFVTKVFEEGGAFSIDRSSIKYSPYEEYAGVKIPQGKMYGGTLETDQDHIVEIATVDEDGKPTSTDCEVKVFKLQWRWWWDSYDRDIKSYISRSSTTPIFNDRVRTSNGKGKFNLRVNRPEYGRYLVYVKNLESGHTTGRIIYIDWPYWARANRKNTENSTMLAFSTDKEAYMTNEQVKLSIPSSSNGRALITVENGTKVLQKFWVDTKKGETKVEFQTTEAMSPNAYVHVSLIQPHAETENDLPIRMYGVVPIMVENPKSHLSPVIKMADELKPETTAKVRIAEKSGRPMTYTLAIVDEGLLDLTSFKTPDPWNHFYAKEALGVKTWDLYDEVLGAFGSKINKMLAIGGDGAGAGKNKQAKVNRFKPMVRFVGPFYYNGNGENTHDIDIPNYVGSVRVMVIAGQDQAYGNAEKTVPVKAPLMVLGTLPRVLGPGEEVDLPVNVFATEDYIKDVQITISANDLLIPKDGTQKSMSFSKKGDKVANFRLKVAEKLGVAKVRINVKSGGEHAHYDVELAVRPSNPETVNVQEIVIQPGESWKGSPEYFGIEGTNSAKLELSTFPPLNLEKRLKYLIRYPHGCIEQTTSGAFPQLYLARLMELNNDYKITIQQNVDAAIARISLFQTSAGGFSYWPGGSSESEWGTNYAGHFLLEAEKLGYKVPSSLISRWERYQKKKAKSWYAVSSYEGRYNDITQAYRLYTLALADKADLASMNRLREKRDLSITARWRLAAAYKLAGQYEIAEQLVKGYGTAVPEYTELSYTFGNSIRDEAMILETLTLMDEKTKGFSVARRIAEKLSSQNWMSTQTTAYCLLSLGKYMGKHLPTKTMYFEYKIGNGDKILKKTLKPLLTYDVEYKDKNIEVTNKSESPLFVRVMTTGIPMQGREQRKAENVSISIDYKDMDGNRIDPKRIEQGTDFIAEVTVRNSGLRGYLKEMALNQIFPSGWEIHNTRMDGFRSAHTSSSFVYQDIRDDRVYTYYNLAVNQTRTYRIQLNATYLGKFYMPSISTEAMYDNTISALEPGGWVEVVKQTND